MTSTTATAAYRMGNGTALHLTRESRHGQLYILCNAWGSTTGQVRPPRQVIGAEATCKKCLKIAAAE